MPTSQPSPKPYAVYLAGPEVFFADHALRYKALKDCCQQHGLTGHSPLDNALVLDGPASAKAQAIYQANLQLIGQCDAVLAHLGDFRGCEPDAGTVFEVGYAIALGKPVVAWGQDLSQQYRERVKAHLVLAPDALRDAQQAEIENFGLPLNLMLACACIEVTETAAQAVAALAKHVHRT